MSAARRSRSGAPALELAANENRIPVPFDCRNAAPSSSNALVRLAAAKTVMSSAREAPDHATARTARTAVKNFLMASLPSIYPAEYIEAATKAPEQRSKACARNRNAVSAVPPPMEILVTAGIVGAVVVAFYAVLRIYSRRQVARGEKPVDTD